MDLPKLIELAQRVNLPELIGPAAKLATAATEFAAVVRANAERAKLVLADGDRAMFDAIHQEALTTVERVDAILAEAERQ